MAKYIEVDTVEEFEQMVKDKDLKISKAIVEGILKNLVGRKKKHSRTRNICKRK